MQCSTVQYIIGEDVVVWSAVSAVSAVHTIMERVQWSRVQWYWYLTIYPYRRPHPGPHSSLPLNTKIEREALHCTMYSAVHCTLLYIVHCCTLYTTVHSTLLYTVHCTYYTVQ